MVEDQIVENNSYKVFFITSNLLEIDKDLQYSISDCYGAMNLRNILNEKYNNNYVYKVFSVDLINGYLKNNKDNSLYKMTIDLKYEGNKFNKKITLNKYRNHFIFDFNFNNCLSGIFSQEWIDSPEHLDFKEIEKIKIYKKALKVFKVEDNDDYIRHFLCDLEKLFLKSKNYDFDSYLEFLKTGYMRKEIKNILKAFDIKKVNLPKHNLNDEYLNLINDLESNANLIEKYCDENENKDEYFKVFYNILLFYKSNYSKTRSLLEKNNMWKYFIEIIPQNYRYYPKMDIPKELILELLKQKNLPLELSFKLINDFLSNTNSLEELFYWINNNIDLISNTYIKQKEKLTIADFAKPKENENIKIILKEICKIIEYESKINNHFTSFQNECFKNYIMMKCFNYLINKTNTNTNKFLEEKNGESEVFQNEIGNLKNKINELEDLLDNERKKCQILNQKIEELHKNNNCYKEKIINLMEELRDKENELKEFKLKLPFDLSKEEKIMTVIFISTEQKIHDSFICKNTMKFNVLENLLYDKYKEYRETNNYFMCDGKNINKYKSLEENQIENNGIISLFKIDQ